MRVHTNGRGNHPEVDANTVQFWRFDQAADTDNLQTFLSSGVSLTQSGTPGVSIGAPIGLGRSFDRTVPEYFSSSAAGALAPGLVSAFSVFAWVKPSDSYANDGFVVGYGASGASLGTNTVFALRVESDLTLSLFYEHGAGTDVTKASTAKVPAGQFSHIVWTWDGTSVLKLYVNGYLAETFTGVTPPAVATPGSNTQRWVVGVSPKDLTTNPFDGAMCSIVVKSTEVSAGAVAQAFWRGMGWREGTTVWWRAETRDGDGDYRDLSSIAGQDWLLSVDYQDDVDARFQSAKLTLVRDADRYSLSKYHNNPLNRTPAGALGPDAETYTEDTTELIALNRQTRLHYARVPWGVAKPDSGSADWQLLLDGRITKCAWPSDMTITVADERGERLNSAMVQQVLTYGDTGTPPTTDVETVMQDLLDDSHTNGWYDDDPDTAGATVLHVPVSPSWVKYQYEVRRESILQHLNWLAECIGWRVKSQFRRSTAKWELTLYEPERGQVAATSVMSNDFYYSIDDIEIDKTNIRNIWRVCYYPRTETEASDPGAATPPTGFTMTHDWKGPATGADATGEAGYAWREWRNTASVTKYGPLYAELAEGATSPIDTAGEADDLAYNCLRDTMEPKATQTVTAMPFPEYEIGDAIVWLGYSDGMTPYTRDLTLALVSVRHSSASNRDISTLQCRGTPCGGHRAWLEKDTSQRGGALPPATGVEEMLAGRTQTALMAGVVATLERTQFERAGRNSIVVNHDFGCQLERMSPPLGWELPSGTWGTDVDIERSIVRSGTQAIKLSTNTANIRTKRLIPVESQRTYSAESIVRRSDATTGGFEVFWYQADGVTAASTASEVIWTNANTSSLWVRVHKHVTAPSNARWARLKISQGSNTASYWDRVGFAPIHPMALAHRNSELATALTNRTWTQVTLNTEVFDYDFHFATNAFTVGTAGKYEFVGKVRVYPETANSTIYGKCGLWKNGAAWIKGPPAFNIPNPGVADAENDGCEVQVVSGPHDLAINDAITLWVYADDRSPAPPATPTPTYKQGEGEVFLTMRHVTQEG